MKDGCSNSNTMHLSQQWTGHAVRGFTLIELMITVAIVALLASLAYPAYTGSIMKGKRAEGRAALTDLLQQQERYLTQTGSYMTFATGAATGSAGGTTQAGTSVTIPFKTSSGDSFANRAYDLGAELCGTGASAPARNECVRVTATPRFTDAEVNVIRLQSTGLKDCTGSNSAKCWR
jgi:type IV pilus assembly protein PilE